MTTMQGIDARRPGWFWAENRIIDEYAANIGIVALGVYIALVRHVNSDGECWPSTATLARKLKISQRQVFREIATLQRYGLVSIEQRAEDKKGTISNRYTVHHLDQIKPDHTPPMTHSHTPL